MIQSKIRFLQSFGPITTSAIARPPIVATNAPLENADKLH